MPFDAPSKKPVTAIQTAGATIGVGVVVWATIGLVVGLVVDDLAGGFGRTFAVGMMLTAVVAVWLSYQTDQKQRTGSSGEPPAA